MPDAVTVNSILDTIGGTPLVQLKTISGDGPEILGKLEAGNPTGSVKDRIGLSMIRAAESAGALRTGMTIVEPTQWQYRHSASYGCCGSWLSIDTDHAHQHERRAQVGYGQLRCRNRTHARCR